MTEECHEEDPINVQHTRYYSNNIYTFSTSFSQPHSKYFKLENKSCVVCDQNTRTAITKNTPKKSAP